MIHSLKNLTAGLDTDSEPVEAVIDNGGDVSSETVFLAENAGALSGIAADGTADCDGLCVIMTDASVDGTMIEKALIQVKADMDTEHFTFIVMANGGAGAQPVGHDALAGGIEALLEKLGFQHALKACS